MLSHLSADAIRQASIPFYCRGPIKAFPPRQTPLAVDGIIVQAAPMAKSHADAPLRGSVAGTVLQAAWTEALRGWHSHRCTKGKL